MPLFILVPLVVIGITLAVVLVRLTINHGPRLLADEADVIGSFALDHPLANPSGKVTISQSRDSAILAISEPVGCLGFVETMGSKRVTRLWTADDIAKYETGGEADLHITLRDFTLPQVKMQFANAGERDAALAMVSSLEIKTVETRAGKNKADSE